MVLSFLCILASLREKIQNIRSKAHKVRRNPQKSPQNQQIQPAKTKKYAEISKNLKKSKKTGPFLGYWIFRVECWLFSFSNRK